MREHLSQLCALAPTSVHARNAAREYLQALILAGMQKSGAMIPLAFHGGTALRFLYTLPRYSEDLDFALERDAANFDFERMLKLVKRELERFGFSPQIKMNTSRTVLSAFIQFPGLLHELNLSSHLGEKLAIKIEIDTNPPAGAVLETTIVRSHFTLHLQHHDRASLLAGKLHAILTRSYCKGRDWYDLLWYLSDPNWPEPNLEMLANALRQKTSGSVERPAADWRAHVLAHIGSVDFDQVRAELAPFIEDDRELQLFSGETFEKLLSVRE